MGHEPPGKTRRFRCSTTVPYSISKLIGEMYGNYYFTRYKLPFVKARFSECLRSRRDSGGPAAGGTVHTRVAKRDADVHLASAVHGEALPVENGGIASRDFIYVEDMARGLMACALSGEPGEIYNLASGAETSILELATRVNSIVGNATPIALTPARIGTGPDSASEIRLKPARSSASLRP